MPKKKSHSAVPVRLKAGETALKAFNLRKAGAGYETIAAELGLANGAEAALLVKGLLDALPPLESPDDIRRLESARLDEMYSSIAEGILAGDLDSIATGLRIQERRARLLGLDVKGDGFFRNLKTVKTAVVADPKKLENDLSVDTLIKMGDDAFARAMGRVPGRVQSIDGACNPCERPAN